MEKINNTNSVLWNQEWINKAIEEGHINFLPVHKFPKRSIGEHIEIKYNQIHNEEFDRYYHNGWLDTYDHLIHQVPKITKKESLLVIREIILKNFEEGNLSNLSNILELEEYNKEALDDLLKQDKKLQKKLHYSKKITSKI